MSLMEELEGALEEAPEDEFGDELFEMMLMMGSNMSFIMRRPAQARLPLIIKRLPPDAATWPSTPTAVRGGGGSCSGRDAAEAWPRREDRQEV